MVFSVKSFDTLRKWWKGNIDRSRKSWLSMEVSAVKTSWDWDWLSANDRFDRWERMDVFNSLILWLGINWDLDWYLANFCLSLLTYSSHFENVKGVILVLVSSWSRLVHSLVFFCIWVLSRSSLGLVSVSSESCLGLVWVLSESRLSLVSVSSESCLSLVWVLSRSQSSLKIQTIQTCFHA